MSSISSSSFFSKQRRFSHLGWIHKNKRNSGQAIYALQSFFRTFFLATSDFCIKDTMFEGGISSDHLDHLRKLFRDNKEEISSLFPNFNLKDFLEINVVDPMSVDLKSLESLKSFLIPGGWNGFPAAHAILLLFTKEKEGFFSCHIFNTGEDAHIHGSILENGTKIKTPNALILKKIPKEKLDETFFRFLSLSKQEHLKGQTFYQALIDYLQADIAIDFSRSLIDFRTPQRSGTCSWKSVMSFLRHLCLDYGTYRRLKHYIFGKKFEESSQYIDLLHTLPQSSHKTQYLNLLEKSADKFARSIAKSFSQGFIQEEKKGYLDLILKIKKQIKQKEDTDRVSPLRLEQRSLTSQPSFSYAQSENSIPAVFSKKGIDTTHFDMSTPEKILICLDEIRKHIDPSDDLYWIIEIISKLALPQDPIWGQFSKEDKIQLARALPEILADFEHTDHFNDRVLSAHYHLLAIADRLRVDSNESIFETASLDVFDFSTYEYLNTFSLSKADIDYRKAVYEYFKQGKDDKRDKKLFYFFTGQSRYGEAYSSLSNELDKTPFERGLKKVLHEKKIPLYALVKDLEKHIPPLDFICFQLFLLTQARTLAELEFTTHYHSDYPISKDQSYGSQLLFNFNLDPSQASSLVASPKALKLDSSASESALSLFKPFNATEEWRLAYGSKQQNLLHPFFATFDLEEFDWNFLNSFLENFTKQDQKRNYLELLKRFIYSERFFDVIAKNGLFREKFTQTMIDFYCFFEDEKDHEMQLYFFFVLLSVYSVSKEIKAPSLITLESLKSRLESIKKNSIDSHQELLLCLEALLLKHVDERDFSLLDLEILIKASSSITNFGLNSINDIRFAEVLTPQIWSIKSQMEHRAKSLLENLSEDDITTFVNRCYFSYFKEVGHQWRFQPKTFTFHSNEGGFFFSYYRDFEFKKVKKALRESSIKLKDLRFNAGCFEDSSGIRIYLTERGIQKRLFLDGAHLKHENGFAIPSHQLEKVTGEHGKVRYPGYFTHEDGTTSLQHVVFDDGHIEKVISREGVIQKYDTAERKVIEGGYCKGMTLSEDSFFPYKDQFGSKFWQDEAGGKTYLEFAKLKKTFILQEGAFFEISDERAELLEPCPLLFSGFTDYLYLQHENLKKALIEISTNFYCELKVKNDLDFMIEKESEKAALALVFFNAHDFIKAYQWIQRCQTVGKLDPIVCEILNLILRAQHNHPDALTCKVKIASLLWQNEILYKTYLDFDLKKQIFRIYKEYISQAGHGELKPLSFEEEQILFIKSDLDPEIIQLRKDFFQNRNPSFFQQPQVKPQPLRNPFSEDLQYLDRKPNFNYQVLLDPNCEDLLGFQYFLAIALHISEKNNLDVIQRVLLIKKLGTYQENQIAQLLQNLLFQQATFSFCNSGSNALSTHEAKAIIDQALVPSITPSLSLPVESYGRAKRALLSTEMRPRSLVDEAFPLRFTPVTDLSIAQEKANLEKKHEMFKRKSQELKLRIEELAATLPQDPEAVETIELKRAAKIELPPTIHELIYMFGLGDTQRYLKSTYLKKEQIQELHQMIGEYLELRLGLCLIEKALEVCEGEESQRELGKLNLPISYNPSIHPELLVFEGLVGIRISEAQTTNLLRLKENPNSAIEMLMGAGKSTVVSPIWALMQIKYSKKLPIIIAPKSLFPRGKEIAKDSFFKAFARFGHGFEFSRGAESQGEKLSLIYQQLLTWKKEKGFIYTTKESILSFILFFEDLFLELEKADEPDKEKLISHIDEASKIFLFFKEECSALFDEAHALLRINEEVNFTVGQCQAIPSSEANMIKELVLELLKIDEGALEQNRQAENKDFKGSFYQHLMEFIKERFHLSSLEYFEGSARKASDEIMEHEEKDLIALCKELVERLLPHTLSKKVNEHFGLRENSDVAIPYVANNTPNPSSEFGSPYETFLYTLYYYINQPIRLSSIENFLCATLESAKNESLRTLTSVNETSKGIDFKKLFGISLTDPEALAILQTKINASPQTRLDFVMHHFLDSIKVYSKKISANPQDLVRVCSQTKLMSGTLWNHESFSRKFRVFLDETIEKDTIAVIQALKKDEFLSFTAIEDDKRIEEILSHLKDGRFHALIDCGALIKNISNEALANKILDATEFEGVVFYNEADELYVLERSGEKNPFDACLISKENRFTFYDHRHTTGSDIKQAANARALVSVSEITLKADLYQSLWRMRGLKEKQKIVIIASSTLSLSTPDDLLALVEINQQKRVLEDNFRAQKGEIKAIALAVMREGLAKAQGSSKIVIFDQIKKHLLIEIGGSPFETFGDVTELVEPQKLILDCKNYWIEALRSLSSYLNVTEAIDEISSLGLVTLAERYPTKRVEMGIEVENENDQNRDLDIDHQVSQDVELIDEAEPERRPIFSGQRIEWIQEDSIFDPKPITQNRYQRCIEKIKSMINWFFGLIRIRFKFQKILQPIMFRKFFPETIALKLSDTLKKESAEFDGLFDDLISISSNFLLPYQNTKLFSGPSKPIYRFVVMVHEDKRIETMIIDLTDLKYFREKLKKDDGQSSRRICIYSPTFGITHHGQKEIKLEELMASESFKEQLCQIKFFSGVCDYTTDELSLLKKWIEKKSVKSMWKLFNKILSSSLENKEKFQGSNIQTLFTELLKQEQPNSNN